MDPWTFNVAYVILVIIIVVFLTVGFGALDLGAGENNRTVGLVGAGLGVLALIGVAYQDVRLVPPVEFHTTVEEGTYKQEFGTMTM